ncbi:unnamed protein product [Ectocarpus sp. 12 AP-2014]
MNSVDFVEKEIDSNNVVVFSKSYCPFCTRTKNLFAGLGVDATVYELDQMDDGEAIQAILGAKTGQVRTKKGCAGIIARKKVMRHERDEHEASNPRCAKYFDGRTGRKALGHTLQSLFWVHHSQTCHQVLV